MKLKAKLNQVRRDYTALLKCEFCDHEEKHEEAYDDDYFHHEVIPIMQCRKCGKSTVTEGGQIDKVETKYPSWMIV